MTAAERKALREAFSGLDDEAALTALRRYCADKSNPLAHRSCATLAILDLKGGEAVDDILATFRRELGIDAPARRRAPAKSAAKRGAPKRGQRAQRGRQTSTATGR